MMYKSHVLICGGPECTKSGIAEINKQFERLLREKSLENEVKILKTDVSDYAKKARLLLSTLKARYIRKLLPMI